MTTPAQTVRESLELKPQESRRTKRRAKAESAVVWWEQAVLRISLEISRCKEGEEDRAGRLFQLLWTRAESLDRALDRLGIDSEGKARRYSHARGVRP